MHAKLIPTAIACVVALALASHVAVTSAQDRGAGLALETLSTKANLVSGGDVLVRVSLPAGQAPGDTRIALNGSDVTSVFRPDEGQSTLTGLVTGLRIGSNLIEVSTSGRQTRKLEVTNHPITGPVFSGPQQ